MEGGNVDGGQGECGRLLTSEHYYPSPLAQGVGIARNEDWVPSFRKLLPVLKDP